MTYSKEEAESLSLSVRVLAYARANGVTDHRQAIEQLMELGLCFVLQDLLLEHPDDPPPVYLWRSYLRLEEEARRIFEGLDVDNSRGTV